MCGREWWFRYLNPERPISKAMRCWGFVGEKPSWRVQNESEDVMTPEAKREQQLQDMRRYAREEAESAGLSAEGVEAVIDMAVGNAMTCLETNTFDMDYFEELVAGIIQGYATEYVDPRKEIRP